MTTEQTPENETRQMFVETAARLFAAEATREVINELEKGTWPAGLWRQVEDAGLPWAAVPESAGGAGGTIGDLMAVLREAGRHAVPLPLAETGLGAMLVAQAGLTPPSGPMALVIAGAGSPVRIAGGKLAGRAQRVAFASVADSIVVVAPGAAGTEVAVVPRAAVKIEAQQGQTGEPYDTVTFDGAAAAASAATSVTPERALELAALARVNQMSGAADRVLALATQYAKERVQFGRAISTFQAIQHMLAELATYVAVVGAAARTAARDAEEGDGAFAIMAAKTQAGEAAHKICAIAHQSMGAMGFTYEHVLHHYTRRLWVWRRDYGSETYWGAKLGRALAEAGADAFWPSLTASSIAA
ncbi:acyl-CoA dehydrogenase family protein [Vineibacter terrae]|uniref:acyl-CoA dehydrogenase family protein n=1 Tax=Vineibacter terrae TaxID=2586908 RepID=UPI002E348914|nr:acyl-CoA dehydrogenase family protein [Vineibacter terrae]HEX2889180.1 acyl-CoA dehydrogenase family protein [Vineibacter terrae]